MLRYCDKICYRLPASRLSWGEGRKIFAGLTLFLALIVRIRKIIAVNVGDLRWEEFVGGEINPAEQFAGIVAGSDALLLRNTEIISGNHHLDVPFDLYDGEDTDGGVNDLIGIFHAERKY